MTSIFAWTFCRASLSPRMWALLCIAVDIAIIGFNLLVLIYSIPLIRTAADQPAPVSRLPMGVIYSILPILAACSIYFACEYIVATVRRMRGAGGGDA